MGWGWAVWDAVAGPLPQDVDGGPLATGRTWGATGMLQWGWGGVSHGGRGLWWDTCGVVPGLGYQKRQDWYHPTHQIAHPCEEMNLPEDVLAALGKPLFSHCPVSFSNFTNSWLMPCAWAVLGQLESSHVDAKKVCNSHCGEQKLAPGGAFLQ